MPTSMPTSMPASNFLSTQNPNQTMNSPITQPPTLKTLRDRNGKSLKKGSIVRIQNSGHGRITAVFPKKGTVNIGSIFGGKIHSKGVPIHTIFEDEQNWYEAWSQSERYQSM